MQICAAHRASISVSYSSILVKSDQLLHQGSGQRTLRIVIANYIIIHVQYYIVQGVRLEEYAGHNNTSSLLFIRVQTQFFALILLLTCSATANSVHVSHML